MQSARFIHWNGKILLSTPESRTKKVEVRRCTSWVRWDKIGALRRCKTLLCISCNRPILTLLLLRLASNFTNALQTSPLPSTENYDLEQCSEVNLLADVNAGVDNLDITEELRTDRQWPFTLLQLCQPRHQELKAVRCAPKTLLFLRSKVDGS